MLVHEILVICAIKSMALSYQWQLPSSHQIIDSYIGVICLIIGTPLRNFSWLQLCMDILVYEGFNNIVHYNLVFLVSDFPTIIESPNKVL